MTDRSNQFSGPSLPPCSTFLQGLVKCRASSCDALFPSESHRKQHEQSCPAVAHQMASFAASRPVNYPVQPHRIDTQITTQMANHTIETDSDESGSIVFTPDNSRAPSLCEPVPRRQSGVIRTIAWRLRAGSSTPESDRKALDTAESKRLKKQEKEKAQRGEHKSVLWRIEDFKRNYIGWERREQSGGNGNGAGLVANKGTIMRGVEDLLYFFIHREYVWGLENGDLEARQAGIAEILDAAATGATAPYAGTFLYAGDEPLCRSADSKSKPCVVHGHPDWRECRRTQADPRFVARRNEFLARMQGRADGGRARGMGGSRRAR